MTTKGEQVLVRVLSRHTLGRRFSSQQSLAKKPRHKSGATKKRNSPQKKKK
jgi:hypothetical protein